MARQNTPDVVLLDIDMPKDEWIGALPELAANSAVLMLTNSSESTMIARALDRGGKGLSRARRYWHQGIGWGVGDCSDGRNGSWT